MLQRNSPWFLSSTRIRAATMGKGGQRVPVLWEELEVPQRLSVMLLSWVSSWGGTWGCLVTGMWPVSRGAWQWELKPLFSKCLAQNWQLQFHFRCSLQVTINLGLLYWWHLAFTPLSLFKAFHKKQEFFQYSLGLPAPLRLAACTASSLAILRTTWTLVLWEMLGGIHRQWTEMLFWSSFILCTASMMELT